MRHAGVACRVVERQALTARVVAQSLALTVFFVVVTPQAVAHDDGVRALDALAYALLVGAGLSFSLRGRYPYASYALALTCVVMYLLRGYGGGPIYIAAFLGLVRVVAVSEPRVWIPSAVGGATALAVARIVDDGWSWSIAVTASVWLVGAWLVAQAVGARRGQEAALADRTREAERTRAEEVLRLAAEERLRMAQEVHDVVGHSLAVVSLQAGVAAHLLETRPEQARAALAAIRRVSSEALDDLRAELGLLRNADGTPPPPATAAGLDAVEELVASLRKAGIVVELESSESNDVVLSEVVSAAGYRIIREALTNVARHAGAGSRAWVRIVHGDELVEVEVIDDGVGPPAHNGGVDGSGLAGMCERAAALGGRVEAGAGPDGGFRVWASLPSRQR